MNDYFLLLGASGFFVESNIHKQNNYCQKESNNKESGIDINKQCFTHMCAFSSSLTANNINIIAVTILYVNDSNPVGVFNGIKLGVKITNPKAAADRLVKRADKILSHEGVNSFFI